MKTTALFFVSLLSMIVSAHGGLMSWLKPNNNVEKILAPDPADWTGHQWRVIFHSDGQRHVVNMKVEEEVPTENPEKSRLLLTGTVIEGSLKGEKLSGKGERITKDVGKMLVYNLQSSVVEFGGNVIFTRNFRGGKANEMAMCMPGRGCDGYLQAIKLNQKKRLNMVQFFNSGMSL